ncbi:hypothetical protein COL922a_002828 [Colletotrichum nupharicola]|nr:hypothetical protein COL922a_002828 [Colletotrichum nupharicola]
MVRYGSGRIADAAKGDQSSEAEWSASDDIADFVQELYLKELKAYKPAAVKDSDAQGQVQTFSVPQTPKSPEETDLAASLKEYESMAVEVEGQDAAVAAGGQPVQHDWLMIEEDEQEPHH